jgi:predicted DNA-binding transcriptional regulator AlpA
VPRHFNEHLTADELRVLSVKECAALNNLSWMTFKRMIARGDGPQIVQLSARRIGIRVIDARRWQEARLRSA